jgi:hypothetical protein
VKPVPLTKILHECNIPRLSFMAQAVSPTITRPTFRLYDNRMTEPYFGKMHMMPIAAQVQQAQLPRSLGGAGLRRMEQACISAYIITHVKTCRVVRVSDPPDMPLQISLFNTLVKKGDQIMGMKSGLAKLLTPTVR